MMSDFQIVVFVILSVLVIFLFAYAFGFRTLIIMLCLAPLLIAFNHLGGTSEGNAANSGKAQALVIQNQWRSEGDISVARALNKGGARGCGAFDYIQVKSSEYVVRCGFADEGYKYYVAWTAAEKTIGPYGSIEKLLEVAY